jgi:uncharacterized protein YbbK (DUF523 family)
MSILVSACLLGVNCRYDGGNCLTAEVIEELGSHPVVPVCPEQLGGLPTPRPAAEIAGGSGEDVLDGRARVLTEQGGDVTDQFLRGAQETLRIARLSRAARVLLKQRSPSCGCGQICRGGKTLPGDGVTAALLKREGIVVTSLASDSSKGSRAEP